MHAQKDVPTVTPEGERIVRWIDGVSVRYATVHPDERGELCEIYNPAWGLSPHPLVYVYTASLRPGKVKGWVYHKEQDDRLFILLGFFKIVLYDLRDGSPTKGVINEIHLTERNRGLLIIPKMVAHAVQNIGSMDAFFVNLPTKAYDHADPDKYRIPKDQIPYTFEQGTGW